MATVFCGGPAPLCPGGPAWPWLPIAGLFLVFQLLTRAFKPKGLARIGVGLIYTLLGLVLFLTGVNVGFLPAGRQLGQALGSSAYSWSLIPLGALLGWFIVEAEPAVHVLCVQVEVCHRRRRQQKRHGPGPVHRYGRLRGSGHGPDSDSEFLYTQ